MKDMEARVRGYECRVVDMKNHLLLAEEGVQRQQGYKLEKVVKRSDTSNKQ